MPGEFSLTHGTAGLSTSRDAWDALATEASSPFLTHAWLNAWAAANPSERLLTATVTSQGRLLAGAVFREVAGGWASGADVFSPDWDAVAVDDAARRRLWEGIAGEFPRRLLLAGMRTGSRSTAIAMDVLHGAGYGVLPSVREDTSPYVRLPSSFEELFAGLSHNARQQLRRRRRQLEAAGSVTNRLQTGGKGTERDLNTFLRIEASGWKGRAGTAIASKTRSEQLFRGFVREAAERGWLRLHILELDDTPIAAAVGASIGRESFFLKTGYDETFAHLSPGTLLTVEWLRQAVDEGLQGVDLLGQAQQYKVRWTEETRPRQRLRVFAGPLGRLAERQWNSRLHPAMVSFRDRAREDPALRRCVQTVEARLNRLVG